MKSYWLWLFLNMFVWLFAFLYMWQDGEFLIIRLFAVAAYLILFFIIPLVLKNKNVLTIILSINAVLLMAALFPYNDGHFNPYFLLILSLLIAEAVYRLSTLQSAIVGMVGVIGLIITMIFANLSLSYLLFICIYIVLFILSIIFYKKTRSRAKELDALYEALLSEYRGLKRRNLSEEEMARQEERVLIAREIHDSVGHKLTALVMQLEMLRLQTSEDNQEKVGSLKNLAVQSLEETRRAVKSLKSNEPGGLQGILRLIRQLEMESLIRIHFTVKHGAFSAPLTGEQSFTIYRAVQEALTNIMKHSQAKVAEIMFEAPGGSIFRFEISNPVNERTKFQEGFGLTSMRERLQKLGGDLDVVKTADEFIVTGYIKIDYEG